MRFKDARQHQKKQEPRRIVQNGSKWIVLVDDTPVSDRLSKPAAVRTM